MNSISRNQITLIDEGELVMKELQLIYLERMAERGSHPPIILAEITGSDDHGRINPQSTSDKQTLRVATGSTAVLCVGDACPQGGAQMKLSRQA